MVGSETVSLVVAGVSLVGTVAVALFSAWKQQSLEDLKHNREIDKEVRKYSGPLAVAAWELQERLYDIVETGVPAEHTDFTSSRENLAIMSSFLLAQYLAWSFILREKTQFFAFTGHSKWKRLRQTMYKIDDELDRKVDRNKANIGHWPAFRLWLSEKALKKDENDGAIRSIRWNEFREHWEDVYAKPLAWYERQIVYNTIQAKAEGRPVRDERLRRMQHLLIDLVGILDTEGVLRDDRPSATKKCKTARWCDCESTECKPGPLQQDLSYGRTRRERHDKFYEMLALASTEKNQTSGNYDGAGKAQQIVTSSEKAGELV